ncbi:MAG: M20 family metallopeptidase [Chloroflexota bacterium]|nr:M20 family metallopeptidase [Chloroflexota bacterium]MDE2839427.1 M20 family metallopeptidase [Chloroflexota bacterium]
MSVAGETRVQESAELLSSLVSIPSMNPAFMADGSGGEAGMAKFVEAQLQDLGMETQQHEVLPGRPNVFGRLRVPNSKGMLLFECHMDTVGIDTWGPEAIEPRLEGTTLHGRGSCDAKGCLTGMILALRELAKRPEELDYDIGLLGVVDEEYRFRGIEGFITQGIQVTAAVIGEPTKLELVTATKGAVRFTLQTKGRPAHSSQPEKGNNAIYQMVEVIQHLRNTLDPRFAARSHPLVGYPTWAIGIIHGGHAANVIPETCEIVVDRRIIPGETSEGSIREFEEAMEELAATKPDMHPSVASRDLADWPLDTAEDEPIVQAAMRALQANDLPPEPQGVTYGTDASKLQVKQDVPCIVYGPGDIGYAHTDHEHIDLTEVVQSADVYAQIAREFRP